MYHPVIDAHKNRPQTKSQQPPFYFGGSQVPLEVNELKGKGLPVNERPERLRMKIQPYRPIVLPYNIK
jgi:hypothetical protein